jgi:hypothetical protein
MLKSRYLLPLALVGCQGATPEPKPTTTPPAESVTATVAATPLASGSASSAPASDSYHKDLATYCSALNDSGALQQPKDQQAAHLARWVGERANGAQFQALFQKVATIDVSSRRATILEETKKVGIANCPTADFVAPAAAAAAPALALTANVAGNVAENWKLVATGFPAIAPDGSQVAFLIDSGDGMRGWPDSKLIIKTVRTDAVAKSLTLVTAADTDKVVRLPEAGRSRALEALRKKVTDNVQSASTAITGWTPMTPGSGERGKAFTAGDWSVEHASDRLRVVDAARKVLLDQDAKSWNAIGVRGADGRACRFTPALEHVSRLGNTIVVDVMHKEVQGGDLCERSPEAHVFLVK